VYFDVYEVLDPGCGLVAVSARTGRLAGSCFYHPRPTHVSVGIMNVHPNYLGQGVAKALLRHIVELAEHQEKPLRLVSSAMNLDSFSLYTRAGFVPCRAYQDVTIEVPPSGLNVHAEGPEHVREAILEDVDAMETLEMELVGIRRGKDFRYCLKNRDSFWHVSVYPSRQGGLEGFMISSAHPGCNMIGPGVARSEEAAAALVLAELNRHAGRRPVCLVPVDCGRLVRRMYDWGARNCEMHFLQLHGPGRPPEGVNMPTFLPETA